MAELLNRKRLEAIFLIVLALLITVVFYRMVEPFIITIFLAAIFSGMMYGVYKRLTRWLGGRKGAASALTVVFFASFVYWIWYAYAPSRKQFMHEASLIPFDGGEG